MEACGTTIPAPESRSILPGEGEICLKCDHVEKDLRAKNAPFPCEEFVAKAGSVVVSMPNLIRYKNGSEFCDRFLEGGEEDEH